jgi:hypothetical protein
VPEGFFDGEEAHALDEGAFDLAIVEGRVDAFANVLRWLAQEFTWVQGFEGTETTTGLYLPS